MDIVVGIDSAQSMIDIAARRTSSDVAIRWRVDDAERQPVYKYVPIFFCARAVAI